MRRLSTPALSAALIATLLGASPAKAQDIIGGSGGAPGPALAPTAPLIGMSPVADGTEEATAPDAVSPDSDITIPARATEGDQDQAATVLADQIVLQGDRTLIAAGGVVIWYQGARLVASRLTVDGASGALTIEGPIHLTEPARRGTPEETTLIADSAQLDRELQDGILRGARLVIARELQLAAREVRRSGEGRLTRLDHVVASSCQVCASDPTPLWEIRARSITHDAETGILHFDHPQFRAFGVPLAVFPFMLSAPDPTVERRTGFLRPEIRTTSGLGFGIKTPYFITLGPSADVTLTPYIAASRTVTLETRYRAAFTNGEMQLTGAISRDDIVQDETRGYLFGAARFELPRGYRLRAQVQYASDRAYLLDYDVTDADRLWSGVTLDRVTRERLFAARIGNYDSLREDEDNAFSPAQVADVIWQRRFEPALIGGEGLMEWSLHAHRRPSDRDGLGRDMARASVGLDWRRTRILPGGVVASALSRLDADLYRIAQDTRYDDIETRVTPVAGVELRWPLMGQAGGATHLVEPVVQLLYSPRREAENTDIPNEDSQLIEFDEGNLFATNRFPGWDRREQGLRANLGIGWTRIDPAGWSLGLTAGRIFRDRPAEEFGADSPLSGRRSDWLISAQYDSGDGLAIANRALFSDGFDFSRNELRVGWLRPGLQLSAGYLWIDSDADESRRVDVSELTFNTGWQFAPGWWGTAEGRYDFAFDRLHTAAAGVQYRNECITVNAGLERSFSNSVDLRPETSFDLSVRLAGFGRQAEVPGTVARRSCMR
ncbi:LPS assembly protein LptD [Paracoccus sp. TK19116]|uniref:LPS-assembly protein LptD n=1 Tax=Paracoccus albicereus TaxID=2922394 RepID=A0ABT1MQP4_9RHOB|nr:LPS assembly protein LptD [Paracoccus albicereus]MCQ0970526.1 LPS assembly protein LptD [Paracoccus albicereus]